MSNVSFAMTCEWKKSAIEELTNATKYCAKTFGKRVAEKFLDSVDHQILLLVGNPLMGIHAPELDTLRRQYRTVLVHKLFKLVYYVNEKKSVLYIVSLWDVRRNPSTLVSRIRRKKI